MVRHGYMERLGRDGMMVTFSSKPSEDNRRGRVRDNQRRHREKIRNYIANLESELAETKKQLQDAMMTIEKMRHHLDPDTAAELAGTSNVPDCANSTTVDDATRRAPNAADMPSTGVEDAAATAGHPDYDGQQLHALMDRKVQCCHGGVRGCTELTCSAHRPSDQAGNPVLTSTLVTTTKQRDVLDGYEGNYCKMKPAGRISSTIRCRDAIRTIAENNYAGLDDGLIQKWLQPGFRKPSSDQDGCRVDNHLVFSLLDYITSSNAAT